MFFQDSIGIELSARRIAMVHLKTSFRGVRLANHALYRLEEDGSGADREEIGAQVMAFLKRSRPSSDGIFLTLPAEKTILRQVELPLAAKENLGETLRYELERFVPLSADEVGFDYQVVEESQENNRLKILVAVARQVDIDGCLDLLGPAGKNVSGIEPTPAAWANYFSEHVGGAVDGLVNFNRRQVRICGLTNGHPMFIRTLSRTPDRLNWADVILDSLKPLRPETEQDGPALPVIYCFGTDFPEGLLAELNDRAEFDFRWLDPGDQPDSDPELIGAFGAALQGLRRTPVQFNMLPDHLRKKPSRLSRYLAAGFVILAILTGIAYAGSQVFQQRATLRELDREIKHYSAEVAGLERIQSESQSILKKMEAIGQIQASKLTPLDILQELTEIIPPTAYIRDLNIIDNKVEMEGYADSASELIPLLDASPRFTEVGFLSAINKNREGKETFRIGFKLRGVDPRKQG